MNKIEKQMFRYHIVKMDMQNRFDFDKNFFELDWIDINKLAHYAEIFGIKSTQGGWSPARNLWYQLQKSHEKYINL